jgi:hypothetical protein
MFIHVYIHMFSVIVLLSTHLSAIVVFVVHDNSLFPVRK